MVPMTQRIELSHPIPGQQPLSQIQPESTAGLRGMVLQSIGPLRHEVRVPFHDSQVRGHAILIQTGWDRHWGSDAYWQPGPYLSPDVVFRLIRAGARLVGVDFWEVGEIDSNKLQAVTNLCNLDALPRVGFRFYAMTDRAFAEF
jgi:kynurenine formamidase